MPNIFEYTDYRRYLRDYYQEEKSKNEKFSFLNLCRKAGIKSKGFLHNVMQGKRNLWKANVSGLMNAMKLNKHESDYFENLVAYNQSKRFEDQNRRLERLMSTTGRDKKAQWPQKLKNDQFEFYSNSRHSVIRCLIDMRKFKDNYKWLAKNVIPKTTPFQAKKSVELLERLGLIKKQKNGYYRLTSKSITSGEEVKSLALQNFHIEVAKLAPAAVSNVPGDKRNVTGMTLGISEKTYEEICKEIYALRMRILKKVEEDKNADRVYRLNFQLFPLAKVGIVKRRRRRK